MANSSKLAMRFCLGASAVALATGMAGAALGAPADEGKAVSEVVVTGTRLGLTDAASANPITVITSETLKMTNLVTVDDVLSNVPGIQVNTNAGNGTQTGTAGIQMRDLGFNRTLVLMNGRRYTPSITIAGVSVNVLAIPVSMIDHVEVLKDGASPIYGSDAVAGVVNIITKHNFDGLQLDAEGGLSSRGDRGARHFSVTAGRNFADGDGNVLLNLDYTKRDAIVRGDRDFTQNSVQSYKLNADGTYTPIFGSTISPGGVTSGVRQVGGGALVTFNSPTSFTPLGTNLFVESSNDSTLLPALETYSANAEAHYRLMGSTEAFAEASYAHTSDTIFGSGAQVFPGRSFIFPNAGIVPANNPFNTFGVPIPLFREYDETGQRFTATTGETTRLAIGLRGQLPHDFKWEGFYALGESNMSSLWANQLNLAHLQNSFDPVLCAAAPGCAIANPFGPGSISPAAADYIRDSDVIKNHYTQQILSASLTGELIALPAGKLSVATGVEWRRESGRTSYGPTVLAGQSSLLPGAQDTQGAFTATEVYGEANVPVFKDQPFAKSLSLDLAARYSHYDRFGDGTTWKVGLNWAITPDVRIRGNIGTAFRAPNVSEFAGGALPTFSTYLDPCDAVTGQRSNPAVAANCAAAGLSPAFRQQFPKTSGVQQGNPDLRPEKARESGIGVVLTPSVAPNLAVELDYYRVAISGAVFQPTAQFILNSCYQGAPSNIYCPLVARSSSGQIIEILQEQENIGSVTTDGVDLTASYHFDLASLAQSLPGTVYLTTSANYVLSFKGQAVPGASPVQYAGRFVLGGAFPTAIRFRSNTSLSYGLGQWRGTYTLRTVSSARVLGVPAAAAPAANLNMSEVYYSDLALDYRFQRYDVTVGVQNLTDEKPPFLIFPNNNFDSTAYDLAGRTFFAKVSAKF